MDHGNLLVVQAAELLNEGKNKAHFLKHVFRGSY